MKLFFKKGRDAATHRLCLLIGIDMFVFYDLNTKIMIIVTQLANLKQTIRQHDRFQSLLIIRIKAFNGSWLVLIDVHRLRIVIVVRVSVFSRTFGSTILHYSNLLPSIVLRFYPQWNYFTSSSSASWNKIQLCADRCSKWLPNYATTSCFCCFSSMLM